jgi:hypothetical protein
MTDKIASEAGHFYTRAGDPCYTVKAKDGSDRATTLRDARKLDLVPSVTTVMQVLAKPGLSAWKEKQILMAALTLPRLDGETDDAFATRVIEDSKAQAKAAAERGTALHADFERSLQGAIHGHARHIEAITLRLLEYGIDTIDAVPEKSFAHPLGYGGKVDAHGDNWVVDLKTKDSIGDKTADDLAFDDHAMQLAAYSTGLGMPDARCLNVFVGVDDCKVVVHEWTTEEIQRGWTMFRLALEMWKIKNQYDGRFAVTTKGE